MWCQSSAAGGAHPVPADSQTAISGSCRRAMIPNDTLTAIFFDSNRTIADMITETLAIKLNIYYTPILVALGTTGNSLSVFVFYKSRLRMQSTSLYLTALAISDTVFLMQLLPPWLNAILGIRLFHKPVFCQVFMYASYVSSCLSSWLVVAFTVERFIAVMYPLRRSAMCTLNRARYVVCTLASIAALFSLPVVQLVSPTSDNCSLDITYLGVAAVFNVMDALIVFTLPMTIILILNSGIIYGVVRMKRARGQLLRGEGRSEGRDRARLECQPVQQRITVMLLIVSSFFVAFNLPAYLMRMIAYIYDLRDEYSGIWDAMQQISLMLFNTNYGINFVLYCLSGQNFRMALRRQAPSRRTRGVSSIASRASVRRRPTSSASRSSPPIPLADFTATVRELRSLDEVDVAETSLSMEGQNGRQPEGRETQGADGANQDKKKVHFAKLPKTRSEDRARSGEAGDLALAAFVAEHRPQTPMVPRSTRLRANYNRRHPGFREPPEDGSEQQGPSKPAARADSQRNQRRVCGSMCIVNENVDQQMTGISSETFSRIRSGAVATPLPSVLQTFRTSERVTSRFDVDIHLTPELRNTLREILRNYVEFRYREKRVTSRCSVIFSLTPECYNTLREILLNYVEFIYRENVRPPPREDAMQILHQRAITEATRRSRSVDVRDMIALARAGTSRFRNCPRHGGSIYPNILTDNERQDEEPEEIQDEVNQAERKYETRDEKHDEDPNERQDRDETSADTGNFHRCEMHPWRCGKPWLMRPEYLTEDLNEQIKYQKKLKAEEARAEAAAQEEDMRNLPPPPPPPSITKKALAMLKAAYAAKNCHKKSN